MSYWCDFVAGWAAGSSGLLVGHPMDTVKVRQQSLGINSAVDVIKFTFKYEGFISFYKGMLFPLLSTGLLNSICFGVYGASLKQFSLFRNGGATVNNNSNPDSPQHSLMELYLSGCIGGFAQVFITTPVDLIKIKMQTETGKNVKIEARPLHDYKGSLDCLKKVYHDTGIRGCYKGFHITLMRDIPSSGLYFLTYEKILSWAHAGNKHEDFELSSTIFAGGVAGIISWASILPLDVIKSRIQADDAKNPTYAGIVDCFRKSRQSCGWGVFGRGFWVMSLRAFPVNAISFLSYEGIMCQICRPYCSI